VSVVSPATVASAMYGTQRKRLFRKFLVVVPSLVLLVGRSILPAEICITYRKREGSPRQFSLAGRVVDFLVIV